MAAPGTAVPKAARVVGSRVPSPTANPISDDEATPAPRLHALRPGVSESFPYPTKRTRGPLPIAYFDAGSGPPILLIHGLGGNFTHFEHVAPLLARTHRVIGVDMPGCGDSAKPRIKYSLDLFADSVVHVLDELRIEHAVVVGHSLGGAVGSRAMLRFPKRVRALVLINSAGFWRYKRLTRIVGQLVLRERLLVPAMERLALKLLDNVFQEKNDYTRRFLEQTAGRPPQPTVGEFGRVTESLAAELVGTHFLDELDRFLLPTLVLWGDRDRLIPAANLARWVPRLPQGRLQVFRGCGHMPIIERPVEVVDAIRGFLAQAFPAERVAAATEGGVATSV